MSMENPPACVKCKFWSPYYKQTISGWCTQHQIVAESDHWCERHKPVITSKVITSIPITEAVRAAICFAKYLDCDLSEYCWACHKIVAEVTKNDLLREAPVLAAAARILAAEVERLTKELQS
jgi:hypothetical protein